MAVKTWTSTCPRCSGRGYRGPHAVYGGKCLQCRGAKVVTMTKVMCDTCGKHVPKGSGGHRCSDGSWVHRDVTIANGG